MSTIKRLSGMLKEDGAAYIAHKMIKKIQGKIGRKKPLYTQEALMQQKQTVFPKNIKFSILVPLYNTPEQFLREMIESVQAQTYGNWELCLADGSDADHTDVEKICKQYATEDARVRYRKLTVNMGISGNTNACMAMSTGDYIALFDHDDLLHPAALYEMMQAICNENADFIYTDEDSFYETPADAYSPHYKPDFAPDTLRSYNYICHFTAFSRELMEKVGGFRSEFDGSQDYDLFLRLTEQAERIVHIPKILYYWRNHKDSTASNVAAKPYTMVSAKKALAEHLERVGLHGTVEDAAVPTTYRISYELEGAPLVSVVIRGTQDLETCIRSIQSKTDYSNYEIVTDDTPNGSYLIFLDSRSEILTPDWIEQMLMYAQRQDVGAVGGMLLYPDDTVASAGKIVGVKGTAGDAHRRFPKDHMGYKFRMQLVQNYSAISSGCMMVRKDVWEQAGGFDEKFGLLADVDFCLRLREMGYLIVWTPYAQLRWNIEYLEKPSQQDKRSFRERWSVLLETGDPYYHPNLSLFAGDFGEK